MSLPPILIRPLRAEDEGIWDALWRDYLAFYRTELPEAQRWLTWARLLSGDRWEPVGMLAWSGEEAVGLVHYLFHRSCWKAAPVCYLQDLYARPERRGTGIGRRLVEAVYAAADAAGAPDVYWMTEEGNATARRLYDRIGVKTPFIRYNRAAS